MRLPIQNGDLLYNSDFAKKNNSVDLAWANDGFLYLDDSYDLMFFTDYNELVQRIIHVVTTETGEIPHRTSWGVGLTILQNSTGYQSQTGKVAGKIRAQLGNKTFFPEILSITEISFSQKNQLTGVKIVLQTIYGEVTL